MKFTDFHIRESVPENRIMGGGDLLVKSGDCFVDMETIWQEEPRVIKIIWSTGDRQYPSRKPGNDRPAMVHIQDNKGVEDVAMLYHTFADQVPHKYAWLEPIIR